jgi:type III secretion protein J
MKTPRLSLPSIAACGACLLAGCTATLESGLEESQANRILVVLDRAGIHATKDLERGGGGAPRFAVSVASDEVGAALVVLRDHALPNPDETGLSEVFGTGSLVPTPIEERARLAAGVAGELARSIETIDGVLDARVHVALPEQGLRALDAAEPPARASVLIRYRAARPYDEPSIRRLVAGAVDGLAETDVAVLGIRASDPEAGPRALAHVGPIAVARGSAGLLRGILGALLASNVVLAGLAGWLIWQRRRPRSAAPTT